MYVNYIHIMLVILVLTLRYTHSDLGQISLAARFSGTAQATAQAARLLQKIDFQQAGMYGDSLGRLSIGRPYFLIRNIIF